MPEIPFIPREKHIKIGDISYTIREMLASQRTVFLFESSDIMGEAFPALLESYFADVEKLKEIGVVGVVRGVFMGSNTSPEACADFLKKTILASVKSPKSASVAQEYDKHFARHFDHLPLLLGEIYQLNFGATVAELKKKLQTSGIFTPQSSEDQPKQSEIVQNLKRATKSSMKVNFSNGK